MENSGSTATAHVHRDLEPGSQRFYRVRAHNAAGAGGWSDLAGASTSTAAQANAGDALTVRTDGLPERGEGSAPFAFRLVFSEAVTVTEAAFRAHALAVTGGTVSAASRVEDEPEAWVVTVAPDSGADVTVALRGGLPCDEAGAICTADGRRLGHGLLMAVPGRGPLHGAAVLTGFVLVDATAHADVGALEDGARLTGIDPAKAYGFRAEVAAAGGVESVTFVLTGTALDKGEERTESVAPYSLYGNSGGNEQGAALPVGRYTLTATAWSGNNGEGEALQTLRVSFTVGEAALATAGGPLGAAFEDVPGSHAGPGTPFTLRVAFSEPVTLGEDAFAAHALIVGNGAVTAAARIEGRAGDVGGDGGAGLARGGDGRTGGACLRRGRGAVHGRWARTRERAGGEHCGSGTGAGRLRAGGPRGGRAADGARRREGGDAVGCVRRKLRHRGGDCGGRDGGQCRLRARRTGRGRRHDAHRELGALFALRRRRRERDQRRAASGGALHPDGDGVCGEEPRGRGARHAERVVHGAGGRDGDGRADAADGGLRGHAGGA